MSERLRIAIFGTGAVGGYFGGRLAAAGENVTFIARGQQLDALKRGGLIVESPEGDVHLHEVSVRGGPEEVGPVDVVLFAVKLYDAERAASRLAPLISDRTVVVTTQNGVEVVDLLERHIGADHVAGGLAYIMASAIAPGRIRHTSTHTLVFGEHDGTRSPRLAAFETAGLHAGFQAKVTPTIEIDLWTKFVRLATWAGMTAVTRSPLGVLRDDPTLTAMMRAALKEGIDVARARRVPLPPNVLEESEALVARFPHNAKSSMLEDLENGRRLELPWLSGAIVRMGRESGVSTPVHEFIAAALGPFESGTPEEGQGSR